MTSRVDASVHTHSYNNRYESSDDNNLVCSRSGAVMSANKMNEGEGGKWSNYVIGSNNIPDIPKYSRETQVNVTRMRRSHFRMGRSHLLNVNDFS